MEDDTRLTQQQLILMVVLISLITSVFATVGTVFIIDKTQPNTDNPIVNQTINRIIERIVEPTEVGEEIVIGTPEETAGEAVDETPSTSPVVVYQGQPKIDEQIEKLVLSYHLLQSFSGKVWQGITIDTRGTLIAVAGPDAPRRFSTHPETTSKTINYTRTIMYNPYMLLIPDTQELSSEQMHIPIAQKDEIGLGQQVFAYDQTKNRARLFIGHISQIERAGIDDVVYIQTTFNEDEVGEGTPLMTVDGKLIGIYAAKPFGTIIPAYLIR